MKESEKKKVIAMVLMLAQCSWTPEKGQDRKNHFSNTAYQLLTLFLPEVCFLQAKGKTAENEKISTEFCRAKDKPVLTYSDTPIDLFTYLKVFIPILSLPSPLAIFSLFCVSMGLFLFCFVLHLLCFFRFYI